MAQPTPLPDPRSVLTESVRCAVLAPSSHNTQPWLFRIGPDWLEFYADRTRALPVNDPHDRELTISCGAALLNARIAAAHAGARLDIAVLPDDGDPDLLARVTLAGGGSTGEPLFTAIAERHTCRRAFADQEVPDEVVDELADAADSEGAFLHVLDADQRASFAALVAEGDRTQFADPHWRRELASWMHPRRRGEGLVLRELTAPVTRFVVKHVDVGKKIAGEDAELAEHAPVLAVLATPRDEAADWLGAGQALQRLLLTAAASGLQAGFLNQPIQLERLRPQTEALLGRPGHAQVAMRVGYPSRTLAPAPRRPVAAVTRRAVSSPTARRP